MRNTVFMFWTGGWDSTFRLLQLTIVYRLEVQPIYIVENKNRGSVDIEIKTMDRIKESLATRDKKASKLILPTIMVKLEDIPKVPEVLESFDRLTHTDYLGGQYVYLSSFINSSEIKTIELGIIKQGSIYCLMAPYIVNIDEPVGVNYKIGKEFANTDVYKIFGKFTFPLIESTKHELGEKAEKYGFKDILEMSWSCHQPLPGNIPCGVCPPCCYAIEEGFEYRFPAQSLKNYRKSLKRRVYTLFRKHPRLFYIARKYKGKLKGKKSIIG